MDDPRDDDVLDLDASIGAGEDPAAEEDEEGVEPKDDKLEEEEGNTW